MHGVVTLYNGVDQSQSLFPLLWMFCNQAMLLYICEGLSQFSSVWTCNHLSASLRKSNNCRVALYITFFISTTMITVTVVVFVLYLKELHSCETLDIIFRHHTLLKL